MAEDIFRLLVYCRDRQLGAYAALLFEFNLFLVLKSIMWSDDKITSKVCIKKKL